MGGDFSYPIRDGKNIVVKIKTLRLMVKTAINLIRIKIIPP
ncbi:hypothetical protein FDUTEX481_02265 [Tolypothrix sp. PCC 7601]|nr:hypothetical protein FDUTEX481_02265 [Tolypothrix sp. PCC 7601]